MIVKTVYPFLKYIYIYKTQQRFKYDGGWLNLFEEQDCRKLSEGGGGRLLPLGGGRGGGSRVTSPGQPLPGLSGARRGLVLKLSIAHIFRKVPPSLPQMSFPSVATHTSHATHALTTLTTHSPTLQWKRNMIKSEPPD